jgi:hypothetical protein
MNAGGGISLTVFCPDTCRLQIKEFHRERRWTMADPFAIPDTPTVTEMDKTAQQVRAAIDAIAEMIPQCESPRASTQHALRAHRTVPPEFILSMIAAVAGRAQVRC